MKTWQKEIAVDKKVENFTVGKDREFDLQLARYDVFGSMAHARMLGACKLISAAERDLLLAELKNILRQIESGLFFIGENAEDVHSQVELMLTEKLGETGKKIHTARSRNDQSLLDIKLFIRGEIQSLVQRIIVVFEKWMALSEKHKHDLLPGYTHYQLAMPSSFGLWFAAYAESLSDDLALLQAAYRIADRNPLGSAAGYGSSFPIDRELTTELLGFSGMNVNSVYAQMTRGKTEKAAANAIAAIAATLSRFTMDCTLFMNQEFAYIALPEELTTGSSIMPHKKNPDVLELIRAKCNRLQAVPNELALLTSNLASGYHRDMQLTKEILFPAFSEIGDCLGMLETMLSAITVRKGILDAEKYDSLFTVDAVNLLVQKGMPFRDAYRVVALSVEKKNFVRPGKISHTHTGSIGNPANEKITEQFYTRVSHFHFDRAEKALEKLQL